MHLVFVGVGCKAEQGGDAAVEIAERVREIEFFLDTQVGPAGFPKRATAKIATAVASTTRAWYAGRCQRCPGWCTRHVPSILRWVCRVHDSSPRSGPPSIRVRRCLPRETVPATVAPTRSVVASWGTRKSLTVSRCPVSARSSMRAAR